MRACTLQSPPFAWTPASNFCWSAPPRNERGANPRHGGGDAGSTYRKPGARMLIMADGSYLGLLSGGCLEADLKLHAQEVLESGVPRAVEYDMRGPDDMLFGIGAGCEGAMRVLLEPAGSRQLAATAALARSRACHTAGLPAAMVSVHESADLPLGTYACRAALPPALIERGRAITGGRRVARRGLGRRRTAHAGASCNFSRRPRIC